MSACVEGGNADRQQLRLPRESRAIELSLLLLLLLFILFQLSQFFFPFAPLRPQVVILKNKKESARWGRQEGFRPEGNSVSKDPN